MFLSIFFIHFVLRAAKKKQNRKKSTRIEMRDMSYQRGHSERLALANVPDMQRTALKCPSNARFAKAYHIVYTVCGLKNT